MTELRNKATPGLKVRYETDFRELDFGEVDGIAYDQLTDKWPLLEAFWNNPADVVLPGAEPLEEGVRRVTRAWENLVAECREDTLVIAHGGTLRFILARVLNLDWRNPALYSVLALGNRTISHLQLLRHNGQPYLTVKSIGIPL